jgi:hypothetical protein
LSSAAPPAEVTLQESPQAFDRQLACWRCGAVKLLDTPSILTAPADYLSPQAFAVNLLECLKNDWKLSGESLLELIPGSLAPWQALWEALLRSVKVSVAGTDIALSLTQRLREDPSSLEIITSAYLKLAKEAKERRKPGDPWPVIIIDEANALSEWEDKKSLLALLKFFVFLTKEMQLAHGEAACWMTSCVQSLTRALQSSLPAAIRFC